MPSKIRRLTTGLPQGLGGHHGRREWEWIDKWWLARPIEYFLELSAERCGKVLEPGFVSSCRHCNPRSSQIQPIDILLPFFLNRALLV